MNLQLKVSAIFLCIASMAVFLFLTSLNDATADTVQDLRIVSTDSTGMQQDGPSSGVAISFDGRYVAFASHASNLVYDTNGVADIFVKDLETGNLTRVSTDSNGAEANYSSQHPSISADGRYVAFESRASNLHAGDNNDISDIFVKDRVTGETLLVSIKADGSRANGNNGCEWPDISGNGRFVSFSSRSNSAWGSVFRKDLQTGMLMVINQNSIHVPNFETAVSADGRFVAYVSGSQVYWLDTEKGQPFEQGVSSNIYGSWADDDSFGPSMSVDGRFVAFASDGANLVASDTNQATDIFVKDMQSRIVRRVSTNSAGEQTNAYACSGCNNMPPAISGDGRFVVFNSSATNLVDNDDNGLIDIFVKDMENGLVKRITNAQQGNNSDSGWQEISGDGKQVAFDYGQNLLPSETYGVRDTYITPLGDFPVSHMISYFPWYDTIYGRTWILNGMRKGGGNNSFELFLNALKISPEGGIQVSDGDTQPSYFGNRLGGPVKVRSSFGPGLVSERSLFGNSFEEVWATAYTDLDYKYYWPIYDGVAEEGMHNWIMVANPVEATDSVAVEVRVNMPDEYGEDEVWWTPSLSPGQSVSVEFPGLRSGPVSVIAWRTGGYIYDMKEARKIIASQRVLFNGTFNEMPGIPASSLSPTWAWPWYDNESPGAGAWICAGNPSTTRTVYLRLNGANDSQLVPLPPGETVVFSSDVPTMGGPVILFACSDKTNCDNTPAYIFASQRSVWGLSFSEIAGASKFGTNSHWTWYDNKSVGANNWIMMANLNQGAIFAEISIAGNPEWTGWIGPSQSETRLFRNVIGGPVEVKAWADETRTNGAEIFSSQRVLWNNNFSEILGKNL